MAFVDIPTYDGEPELHEVLSNSLLGFSPGVGVNEMIVAAGFHPHDFGLPAIRAFGGRFPDRDIEEWDEITTPFRILRAGRGLRAREEREREAQTQTK